MEWKTGLTCGVFLIVMHSNNGADAINYTSALGTATGRNYLSPYHQYNRRLMECDGEDNFKDDIGIVSYLLGLISSTAGLFSLVALSVPSNNISIISTLLSLLSWVPSAILTFFAWSDPFSWATGNVVNVISLFLTLYGGIGIFTGTADIIISTIDEVLGISSLALGSLTTFPDVYDDVKEAVQNVLGREAVDKFLRGYGCGYTPIEFGFGRELVDGR